MKLSIILIILISFMGTFYNLAFSQNIQTKLLNNKNVDDLIIKFKKGVSSDNIERINKKHNCVIRKKIKRFNYHLIRKPKSKSLSEIIKDYKKNPEVEIVEPNYFSSVSLVPNDLNYSDQWGLKKIMSEEAWGITTGNKNIVIGILDSGIDYNHIDLKDNVIKGLDIINNDNDAMDDNGHGTFSAGIIGAKGNNNNGICGVMWNCSLMPLKVVGSDGIGTYADLIDGIRYAVENGAKILNIGLGGYFKSQILQDTINYAYNNGCIIVAAAGNENTDRILYPAGCSNVLAVGATDNQDKIAPFSNYGDYIPVLAPGVDIVSTDLNNKYSVKSGTSASASFVSGIVGLVLSKNPKFTNKQVMDIIIYSSEDVINK